MGEVSFWNSAFMWRDAVVVSGIAAAVLSYLGVWVTLKRVVYVPLALSQVSSVGVVLSFLFCSLLDLHQTPAILDPAWVSLTFAVATAFYFARPRDHGDTATVVAYLLAAAGALLVGGFVRQDVHDVESILFGSAVLVETIQIAYVGFAGLTIAVVHVLFFKRFLYVSFDADTAAASRFPVYATEVVLYLTFAVMISVTTRAIGALPAFGFTVLPAMAALNLSSSMGRAFAIAIVVGIASALVGYYLSFVWELPTGATMVSLAGLVFVVTRLWSRATGRASA